MIFISVGSQKFQFNRLLKKVDLLIQQGKIKETVFAQIGNSTYRPKNYKCIKFMSSETFDKALNKCNIIITHGGTGTIINSLKKGKKVIGVPRLRKYKEHVDDHQIQILDQFKEGNYIEVCYNLDYLVEAIKHTKTHEYEKYKSNRKNILKDITNFIEES